MEKNKEEIPTFLIVILSICIVGIVFGALVISGYLYVAILTLVQKVFEVLGIGG